MKKILSLFALVLLSCMGAWAQTSVTTLPTGRDTKVSYMLITPRGALFADKTQNASNFLSTAQFTTVTVDGSDPRFQFLLFHAKNETNGFYIYNVGEQKFIGTQSDTNVSYSDTPVLWYIFSHGRTLTNQTTGISGQPNYDCANYPWCVSSIDNTINNGAIAVSNWSTATGTRTSGTTWDGGNHYMVAEAETVSDEIWAAAKEKVVEYEDGWPALEAIIAEAEAYPYGDKLGEYSNPSFASELGEAKQILTYHQYGIDAPLDKVTEAISNLRTAINGLTLNMPQAGTFLRLKGVENNTKYLLGTKTNDGSKFSMGTAQDATSVFYYDANHLLSYTTGLFVGTNASDWKWKLGEGSEVNFYDASTKGAYRVNLPGNADKPYTFLYSGPANANNADRGGFANVAGCTDTKYQWTLEEVTALPVTITSAGYATFNCPVAVEIPSGVQAYTGAVNGNVLTLTKVEDVIPANTPVVLKGDADTYNFTISNSTAAAIDNALTGTVAAIAAPADILTLQDIAGVGFYRFNGTNLRGFSAYIPGASSSNLRIAFDETTGINAIDATIAGGEIFDLTGRRVNTIQKGQIYVKNGKKFMF